MIGHLEMVGIKHRSMRCFERDGVDFSFSDLDARPWDFQAEECSLRACVDRFNNRRYTNLGKVDYE